MRTFQQKNAVGGFIGGFVGLLLIGWAGLVLGLVGCAIGFLMGFYYEPIAANARQAWTRATTGTASRAQYARAIVWRSRMRIYFVTVISLVCYCYMFWEMNNSEYPQRMGSNTWNSVLGFFISIVAIPAIVVYMMMMRDALKNWGEIPPPLDSSTYFEEIDDWMLSVLVLIVFVWIPRLFLGLFAQLKRFVGYLGRLRKDPALQVPWALTIARSVYCAVWLMTFIAINIASLGSGSFNALLVILSSIAWTVGLLASQNNVHGMWEYGHREVVRQRRLDAFTEQGFWRYTLHFTVRMFSVGLALAFTICWGVTLIGTLILFWATGLALPVYFAYYFVRGLRRVSDGTHWVGMITTLAITVYSAIRFNGQLDGYTRLIAAFICGILSGFASVLAAETLGILCKRITLIKRFVNAKPVDIWKGMGKWKPSERIFEWIMKHSPLENWLDRVSKDYNFGL